MTKHGTCTMDVKIYRKWWQLWKPRYTTERRAFFIAEGHSAIASDLAPGVDGSIWNRSE